MPPKIEPRMSRQFLFDSTPYINKAIDNKKNAMNGISSMRVCTITTKAMLVTKSSDEANGLFVNFLAI